MITGNICKAVGAHIALKTTGVLGHRQAKKAYLVRPAGWRTDKGAHSGTLRQLPFSRSTMYIQM